MTDQSILNSKHSGSPMNFRSLFIALIATSCLGQGCGGSGPDSESGNGIDETSLNNGGGSGNIDCEAPDTMLLLDRSLSMKKTPSRGRVTNTPSGRSKTS